MVEPLGLAILVQTPGQKNVALCITLGGNLVERIERFMAFAVEVKGANASRRSLET